MPNGRHVALGTISFTVCFAAWGLIGAFAPRFRELYHLDPSSTAFLVAVPVLLGSLARIPMGRTGGVEDIARTVVFLAKDTTYITGQVLAVDGGRSAQL